MIPYKILFQKMATGAPVIDTQAAWGIVCKDFPFKLYGDAKELPAQDWYDEHGADEYIPKQLKMAAYDIKVEFVYKGANSTAQVNIRQFLDYLTGNDGQNNGAELKVYDAYTRIGRQKVRYKDVDNTMIHRYEGQLDVFTFTVTFRINDPMTNITL
jgi:hypothetical protein